MSTVGSAGSVVASKQDFTNGGGVSKLVVAGAGPVLVNVGRGRLMKILVTVTLAAAWTFYDTANTSNQTGATIIGVIPSGAAAGAIYDLRMPTDNGIVAVAGSNTTGSMTVSFS